MSSMLAGYVANVHFTFPASVFGRLPILLAAVAEGLFPLHNSNVLHP